MNFFARWRESNLATRLDERTWAGRVATALPQERWMTWGIFVLLLVLIFLRAPTLLLEPRLWAEEASLFLRYAYTHDFLDSLLFVPQKAAGYFSLACTLPATIAAHLFPVAYAPVVTMYFSLGILLMLFALILWGHSSGWDTLRKKTLACLIILFAPSSNGVRTYFVCGAGCPKWVDELNRCELTSECMITEWLYSRWQFRWPRPAQAPPG